MSEPTVAASETDGVGVARVRAAARLLRADDIDVVFRTGAFGRRHETRAVKHATLTVDAGEIVGLVGESGSGKSTLARVIAGIEPHFTGTVSLDGAALHGRRTRGQARAIQMVFQDPYASLDPRMTVGGMIDELLRFHRIVPRERIRERTRELVGMVRLGEEFLDRRPGTMSGGQRQRVAIARALALEPRLVIADEAVSALDVSIQAEIIALFEHLRKTLGIAVLFISHDLAVVERICDRVAVIHFGEIVESGPAARVFAHPEDDYTRRLLDAVPRFESRYLDEHSDLALPAPRAT